MKAFLGALTGTLLLTSWAANAQELAPAAEEPDKGFIMAPGITLEPAVEVDTAYTDNLYRTRNNEKSAFALLVKPSVDIVALSGANQYALSLVSEVGRLDTSKADSYLDHSAKGEASLELTSRNRVDLTGEYRTGHDPFGTARTAGAGFTNAEIDRWGQVSGLLTYTYGSTLAPINLHLKLGASDKEYLNNPQLTSHLDYDLNQYGAGGSYRLGPKTALTLDYDYYQIDFHTVRPGLSSRSGDGSSLLLGVKWQATGKTTGTVQIGQYARNFDAPDRKDVSGLNWSVAVTWRPLSYSALTLRTAHVIRESYNETENFNNTELFDLYSTHDWTPRLHSEVGLGYARSHFESNTNERKEVFNNYHGLLRYDLTSIVALKGGFDLYHNRSSLDSYSYRLNTLFAGVSASF